jgi:hypothetical protein
MARLLQILTERNAAWRSRHCCVSNSSCPSPAMAAFSAATILWNMFAHARWPEEKRCRGMKTTRRLKSRLNFPKWGKRIAHVHVPRCGLKIGLGGFRLALHCFALQCCSRPSSLQTSRNSLSLLLRFHATPLTFQSCITFSVSL